MLKYWDLFGTPTTERQLKKQVQEFVAMVESCLNEPVLQHTIPCGVYFGKNPFSTEFVGPYTLLGNIKYTLPEKWEDRLSRMTSVEQDKKPQTTQYWYDAYFQDMDKKHESGQVTDSSHSDRKYALANFKKFVDLQAHVTTLGNGLLDKYDDNLQANKSIKRKTKISYMKTAKMFIRWCKLATDCDLVDVPLLEKKYRYVESNGTGRTRQAKKLLLWSEEDFQKALQLPEPYNCYCLLMLNCGFRHMDLSHLQQIDIDADDQRIVIQRQKLNKLETAPVISYKLWDATWQSLQDCKRTTGKLVFGSVHDAIKSWWKRSREDYGLEHRTLDYLRKTGASSIKPDGLSDMYLGECLSTTTQINYKFTDGDPCPELDRAIQQLGYKFGLAPEPPKTIELTPEVLAGLRKLGVRV